VARILVVTAAAAERDAVVAGRSAAIGMVDGIEVHRSVTGAGMVDSIAGGVGVAAAAVATCCALRHGYDLVLSAGIAGGFPAAPACSVVVAHAVVHADLGTQTPAGFTSMAALGWGPVRFELDQHLSHELAQRTGGVLGSILTVSSITGTQPRADELRSEHPDAVAEAMEGVGVYRAATMAGVAFGEIRTISNRVGPRNRDDWRVGDALSALTVAFDQLLADPLPANAWKGSTA
jgi:futalosine hydrolase